MGEWGAENKQWISEQSCSNAVCSAKDQTRELSYCCNTSQTPNLETSTLTEFKYPNYTVELKVFSPFFFFDYKKHLRNTFYCMTKVTVRETCTYQELKQKFSKTICYGGSILTFLSKLLCCVLLFSCMLYFTSGSWLAVPNKTGMMKMVNQDSPLCTQV